MKYSEFKKAMENKGFTVEKEESTYVTRDENNTVVCTVSMNFTETYNTAKKGFVGLSRRLRRFVMQKCMELACTNLKDREEEYWFYRAKLTETEFNALSDNLKLHNWEKVKVEEEEDVKSNSNLSW